MKLSEIKKALTEAGEINFVLPNGDQVPSHFHVTEIGNIKKHFIDCGGTIRTESTINFQLFTANDYDHRLSASKLNSIIGLSEKHLKLEDGEIEVEYQGETIGKYGLEYIEGNFHLIPTQTDCLAKDECGIPSQKQKVELSAVGAQDSSCSPGSGCC